MRLWSGGVRYVIWSGAAWSGVVSITIYGLMWTCLLVSVTLYGLVVWSGEDWSNRVRYGLWFGTT